MTLTNDMTKLLNKIARRNGLTLLERYFPKELKRNAWAEIIQEDSLVTFSRYIPHMFPMVINDQTCHRTKGSPNSNFTDWGSVSEQRTRYYIKPEVLNGVKLLGVRDIDWTDWTAQNSGFGSQTLGNGYFITNASICPEAALFDVMNLQMAADFGSLFNRGITVNWHDGEGYFTLEGIGNIDINLDSFVLMILVEHNSMATISPTKMEVFETIAEGDVCNFLYQELLTWNDMETVYVTVSIKQMEKLQQKADKRDDMVEKIKEDFVSAANESVPIIWTI